MKFVQFVVRENKFMSCIRVLNSCEKDNPYNPYNPWLERKNYKIMIDKELNKSIEECLAAMAVGVVYMVFLKKKDGTFRIARATRCPALIPPREPSCRRRKQDPDQINFYDIDIGQWRSMKRENFAGFTPLEIAKNEDIEEDEDCCEDYDEDHPRLEQAYRGMDANDYSVEAALQRNV